MLSKQINRRMKITISSGAKGVSSFLNVSSVRTNNSRSLSMTLRNTILLYPYNNPVKEVDEHTAALYGLDPDALEPEVRSSFYSPSTATPMNMLSPGQSKHLPGAGQ